MIIAALIPSSRGDLAVQANRAEYCRYAIAGLRQLKAVLPRMAVLAGIWAGLVGLLIGAGEAVVHSAAVTHFDHHTTRGVVARGQQHSTPP